MQHTIAGDFQGDLRQGERVFSLIKLLVLSAVLITLMLPAA